MTLLRAWESDIYCKVVTYFMTFQCVPIRRSHCGGSLWPDLSFAKARPWWTKWYIAGVAGTFDLTTKRKLAKSYHIYSFSL